jgi:NTP pyrophosphatase (non-canonical NTP hydrolase)
MDLEGLQREADAVVRAFDDGYWPPFENLARLVEEVGELARALGQSAGHKRVKQGEVPAELALEMGDVLFTLAVLANQSGVDLAAAVAASIAKYRRRDLGGPTGAAERR